MVYRGYLTLYFLVKLPVFTEQFNSQTFIKNLPILPLPPFFNSTFRINTHRKNPYFSVFFTTFLLFQTTNFSVFFTIFNIITYDLFILSQPQKTFISKHFLPPSPFQTPPFSPSSIPTIPPNIHNHPIFAYFQTSPSTLLHYQLRFHSASLHFNYVVRLKFNLIHYVLACILIDSLLVHKQTINTLSISYNILI